MGIKIIGTGKKIPSLTVKNEDLSAFLDTDDDWIISKTGIKTRTICTSESLTDLAEEAVRIALDKAQISISDINLVIGATMTGDYLMPSLACCVLERFGEQASGSSGAERHLCPAYDLNAACSGFIYALDAADSAIKAGKAEYVLIVAAEMMSRMVDWRDRTSSVLFGDGACACIVTKGDSLKYIRTISDAQIGPLFAKAGRGNNPFIEPDSKELNTKEISTKEISAKEISVKEISAKKTDTHPGYLEMQGQHVYKFAVKAIESEIHSALDALDMKASDVDYFILHQANTRIIDGARMRLKLPPEKFPMNIQKYGNMSAASIPVLLDEMIEDKRIQPGNIIMLIGFGAGMTAGCAVMEY